MMKRIRFVSRGAGVSGYLPLTGLRLLRAAGLLAVLLVSILVTVDGMAQNLATFSGTTTVGQSTSQTVTVTAQTAGTVSSVQVLTVGQAGLDYTVYTGSGATNTCAGANLSANNICQISVAFSPLAAGVRSGAVVLLDSSNNTLGIEYLTGTGLAALGVMVPGTIQTLAGTGNYQWNGDGAATDTNLNLPAALVVDGVGDIFVADSRNNSIREISGANGNKQITTICGNPTQGGYSGDGGPALNATLNNPQGLAIDGAGNLYIADTSNNSIRKIDAFTHNISTVVNLALSGSTPPFGYSGDGGPATQAQLHSPNGVTVDAAGDLYIADTYNQVIREVTYSNGIINTVAGTGAVTSSNNGVIFGGYSGDGGAATSADLNQPTSIAFDQAGDMYIADFGNNRIRIVSASNGTINTYAGNGQAAYAGDGQSGAANMSFNAPSGLAVDPAGNVYIADSQNYRVRKINLVSGKISTIAGNGGEVYGGDNGPATQAGLFSPQHLALDSLGNLYIADFYELRIREIQSNTVTLTFGAIREDQTEGPQVQPIENDGNTAMTFSSITDSNAATDATTTTCTPLGSVVIDAQCNVGAEFAPTEAGDPVVGNITLTGNPSNSPLVIQVSGEADQLTSTTTTLSATPNPQLWGSQVTMTATVSTGTGTLGGNVEFMDGSTELGSVAVTASGETGAAIYKTSSLAVGPHQLTAVYEGDGVHGTSTSSPAVTENIQGGTGTTVSSSENPSTDGDSVTFTATVTVSAGATPPTSPETVTFKDGSTTLGSGILSSVNSVSSQATFTTSSLTPGTHSITASYSGDSENASSASSALSQAVRATTTTTVSSSSSTAAYASTVTFTATVVNTTSTGAPSGTVSFTVDGSPLGSATTLSASRSNQATASVSSSTLSVGTHTIVATYNGTTSGTLQFAGSTSSSFTETIQTATPATTLVSSLNPSAAGQGVTFSVTVSGGAGAPTPSGGTVTLEDGGTPIAGPTPLVNGTASFVSVSTLSVGTHTMKAVYSGSSDGNYGPSTSNIVSQRVLPVPTVSIGSNANPSVAGASVTITVTVSGSSPTGSVTLKDGLTSLLTLTLVNGTASYSTSSLALGTHSLTAVYSGDSNNAAATSSAFSQVVNQATTTTTVGANTNPLTAGKQEQFTAKVTSDGGTPTGSVSFYSNGGTTPFCSASLSGGMAVCFTSTMAVGTDSITATYAGDTNDTASTSTPYSLTVNQATTVVNLVSSHNPATALSSVIFTATVTGNGGTPGGQVVFSDNGTPLPSSSIQLNAGVATYSTTSLAVGQHTITAAYQGDTNDSAASASLTQTIQLASTGIAVSSSLNPSVVGNTITLTTAVTGTAGTPTGNIVFQDGGATIATQAIAANGTATFSTSTLALGQHRITVSYSGDANNAAATSATLTQTVQQATATTLASSKNPSIGGTPVTFTATMVGSSGAALTGSVIFKNGASVLATVPLTSAGVATLLTTSLPVGANAITAVYIGDTLDVTSTSAVLTQTVQSAVTTTALTSSENPAFLGDNVTFTATVTGTGVTPTGSVTFMDGSTELATVNLNASGVATYSTGGLVVGVHPITAVYNGDQYDQKNTSAVLNQTVQAHVSVTVVSSANPALAASTVTFTVTVKNGSAATPTGSLTLLDGTTALAQFTLPVSGIVTFSTSSLAVGSHAITATYGGDTDNVAANSNVLTQVIQAIPTKTTLGASPTSLNTEQQVNLVASVFSAGTVPLTGTVTFQSDSTVIGSVALTGVGTATLSATLNAGSYNIVAVYSGDSLNATSTSAAVSVTVIQATDFNMALSPNTMTVASKQYGTVTLTLSSSDGFTDQLGMGCASLPASVTCAFSQDTVNLPANGSASVQVTIDTASPLTSGGQAKNAMPGGGSPEIAAAWIFPAGAVFGLFFWRFRRKHSGVFCLLLVLLLTGAAFTITGCSGLVSGGAQPGTYTFQVTAAGVKTRTNHAVNITLTVN